MKKLKAIINDFKMHYYSYEMDQLRIAIENAKRRNDYKKAGKCWDKYNKYLEKLKKTSLSYN